MKKRGIYFGGGGGYFTYYLGIACYLQENYDLSNIVFGGMSAGSIVAVYLACVSCNNSEYVNFLDIIKSACRKLRETNTMNPLILNETFIGKNAVKLFKNTTISIINNTKSFSKLQNNCFVLITDVHNLKGQHICEWCNVDDLCECLLTSCWIPFLFDGFSNTFRNKDCLDGCVSTLFSNFNNNNLPPNFDWIYIDLSTFGRFDNNPFQVIMNISTLLIMAHEEMIYTMYEFGYKDAKMHKTIFQNIPKKKKNI